jgi:hypothetical protein
VSRTEKRTDNRLFFPQEALDHWIVDARVDLRDDELTILAAGRRFKLAEAVRVLREVSDTADPHELVGRVKARAYLEQLGAEIIESSMLVGEAAYDVEPGWIGIPIGTFDEHVASEAYRLAAHGDEPREPPTSDEDLVSRFLETKL